jgi:hypothetical protein
MSVVFNGRNHSLALQSYTWHRTSLLRCCAKGAKMAVTMQSKWKKKDEKNHSGKKVKLVYQGFMESHKGHN